MANRVSCCCTFLLTSYLTFSASGILVESKQLRCEFLVDLKEHILESRHGYTVALHFEFLKFRIKCLEECLEVSTLVPRDDIVDFITDLGVFLKACKVDMKEGFDTFSKFFLLLDHSQLVSGAESILQE